MQWKVYGHILLFSANLLWSQTYIIKFRSAAADTLLVRSAISRAESAAKLRTTAPLSFTVNPINSRATNKGTSFPWNRYVAVRSSSALSSAALNAIAEDPAVEYIHPSTTYKVYSIPNDSAYSSQWNIRRTGIEALHRDGTINASLPGVIVGVIDTGIDEEHPDLVNSLAINTGEYGNGKQNNAIDDDQNGFIDDWRGFDFVELDGEDAGDWKDRDNDPSDENRHGTAVAGIIGAQTNNGIGIAGIAPAKILPLRAFAKNGNGNDIDIATAIIYAADNGADVINMSFGDVVRSVFLQDAIRYAFEKNVVLVASSGNDGTSGPHYPSDFYEVISTGAVGQFGNRSFFSSHSPALDIMAPGEEIVTTVMGGGYTGQFAGTSAAAPHVSGIAALMKSIEFKKINGDPSYIPLANDEIKGILLNSADDAGEPGWDDLYGAGIVNAEKALQAAAGSVVTVNSPVMDQQFASGLIPVVITAIGPYLRSVSVSFGAGENPTQWIPLTSSAGVFYSQDTVTSWNINGLESDTYVLRLRVENSKGGDQEFRQRVFVGEADSTVAEFHFKDSVIIGDGYGAVIEARTHKNTTGKLFYRKSGTAAYQELRSAGLQRNHAFILTTRELVPEVDYEFYCEFSSAAAPSQAIRFPKPPQTSFDHFTLKLSSQAINTTKFIRKPFTLPNGFLLNAVRTIGTKPTVIMNEYTPDNDFGKLKAFEFSGGGFTAKDSNSRQWVPRGFERDGSDGSAALLVQEHGVSRLFRIDTVTGKYFQDTIWGDSTDVWASTLTDLDGNGSLDIIARNSRDYLIYKQTGNTFTVADVLINPTSPLAGDAKNQFGPPRSLVGDFTASGKKEIIVADYDGDFILYRESTAPSLSFEVAGIDTSKLFDMSDHIVSGDFNGDGIKDFAVAGHSNPDWNNEREYDAPVWTVRVFSHTVQNAPGSVSLIWQQYFVGVKAGSGYDNGLVTGKLRVSDTQDALMISFNPRLYVFEWDGILKTFVSTWVHSSQTNSIIVHDFDQDGMNDLGFHTNGKTEFWSLPGGSLPDIPYNVSAKPVTSSSVRISWNSPVLLHNIYRSVDSDSLQLIASVSNANNFLDTGLTAGTRYFYSITSVTAGEGQRSATATTVPHSAPVITAVEQVTAVQLSLRISYAVASEDLKTMAFILDSSIRSASVLWKSDRQILATFPVPILPGAHSIRIAHLSDEEGMEGDTAQTFSFNTSLTQQSLFFIRTASLISGEKVKIEFSEKIDFSSVKALSNFSVRSIVRPYTVSSVDSIDPQSIVLRIKDKDLTRIAVRLEITIGDSVRSASGVLLNNGKGQVVSIAQQTASIGDIVVYPNPVRHSNTVSFMNIPVNCRITIYSPAGDKITTLSERTTAEGAVWNLRTESGNIVSTGIYLYRVEQLDQAQGLINSTVGKFAVIR